MEDCYGLMGLKVTWTDLNCFVCLFVCCCCFGGRGGSKLFHNICVLVFMTHYASNKFSSLLFSPGTLNGHVDNVV